MSFDELVNFFLEEFNTPYDKGSPYRRKSMKDDILQNPAPTKVTSKYDNYLAAPSPTTLPGNMFPNKQELKRRARKHRK